MLHQKETLCTLLSAGASSARLESYNRIRANLVARAGIAPREEEGDLCPVIGFSTVSRRPARRYLCVNLALSFARLGLRVLLIDADMHGESISPLLDVAEGGSTPVKVPGSDLFFLPRGNVPNGSPSDYLGSSAFLTKVEDYRTDYDVIFVSLPAVTVYADAFSAAPSLCGMVLGVATGHDRRRAVADAVGSLQEIGLSLYGLMAYDE